MIFEGLVHLGRHWVSGGMLGSYYVGVVFLEGLRVWQYIPGVTSSIKSSVPVYTLRTPLYRNCVHPLLNLSSFLIIAVVPIMRAFLMRPYP